MKEDLRINLLDKIKKIDAIFYHNNECKNANSSIDFLSNFVALQEEAYCGLFWDPKSEEFNCKLFYKNLRKMWNHLRNIFTLISMIEELNYKKEQELPSDWSNRIGLYIKYFHVEFRSLLDFMPKILSETATKKGQIPSESFSKLVTYCSNPEKREIAKHLLSDKVVNSISEIGDCFIFVRDIRDFIIHYAAEDLVFGGKDTSKGILFTISKFGHHETLIRQSFIENYYPIIKYNEDDVFNFEYYATILLLYLLDFLEELSAFYMNKYKIINKSDCPVGSFGMDIYKQWLQNLDLKLNTLK